MRSFHLFLLMLSLSIVTPAQSADTDVLPAEFFTVTLPYGEELTASATNTISNMPKAVGKPQGKAQQAMQVLLMRLTGRQQLLSSAIGQDYINNAKSWLSSFKVKPRMEDGVVVGQSIDFKFDANRLKKSFAEKHIKLWAANIRPSTMVMGSFVQQGRLEKLDQEILNYRIDVDYRHYPQELGLPVFIPESSKQWVFPVEPTNNHALIQELLLTNSQQNLLSFKLQAKPNGQYGLDWYLFAVSGSTIATGSESGSDRQSLLKAMFESTMQRYVKLSAVQSIRKNHLYLTINQVAFGDQVSGLEADIQAQQPMIRSIRLSELQAGKAIFDIEYQGDYSNVVNWLKQWPRVVMVDESQSTQKINVNVNYQYFPPELKTKAETPEQPQKSGPALMLRAQ